LVSTLGSGFGATCGSGLGATCGTGFGATAVVGATAAAAIGDAICAAIGAGSVRALAGCIPFPSIPMAATTTTSVNPPAAANIFQPRPLERRGTS
jgi:hypothetical protein